MKLTIWMGLMLFFMAFDLTAQRKLNGTIVNRVNEPISGVRVSTLSNFPIQTLTDEDGHFFIILNKNDKAVLLSHVGYIDKTVAISSDNDTLRIVLETKSQYIDEVEVLTTGYQNIPKERATGSFEIIGSKDLERRVSSNIMDKLEGQIPGLQYDKRTGSAKINIRGINTMSEALMGPLIVVDNFPFEGRIEDINPEDVASVTVLKDAAAASIWGTRAGNGVIVINLKRPVKNSFQTDFSSNYTMVDKARIKDVSRISASDFIDVERMLFEKNFFDASYNNINNKFTVFSPVVEMLYANKRGTLSLEDLESHISKLRQIDYRDELQRYLYRNETLQQYALAISNGNSKGGYRISVSYNDSQKERIGDRDKNLSINLQNTMHISDRLDLATRLTFLQYTGENDGNPMDYNFSPGGGRGVLYPYAQLRGETGENLALPYVYNSRYINTVGNGQLLDWRFIPLDEIGLNTTKNGRQQIDAQLNLKYTITPWLKLDGVYNYQGFRGESRFLRRQESFYTRNLINRFTQITNGEIRHVVPVGAINQMDHTKMQSHKLRGNLSVDKISLDGQHGISAIAGAELSSLVTNTDGYTVYGYDPLLMTSQQVDLLNFYPIYDGLAGNSKIPSAQGFNETTRRFVSFFANASYTFQQRYTATFSARRDASNLFGVNTNDKWNPLWSTGLAWSLDKERFLEKISWVNGLRLRGTYGHSGNSGGVATSLPTISHMSGSSTSLTPYPRAMIGMLPNPSLKWEDVRMINLAVTFDLFRNLLSGSVEYFNKRSTDLLAVDNIDPTVGLSSVRRNVGILDGNGWDIKLTARKSIRDVNVSTTVFLSLVKDVVKEFRGNISNAGTYVSNTGRSLRPLPDKQLYPVFALRFAGLDPENGDPRGWLNGEISKEYQKMLTDSLHRTVYYGTGLPTRHGSLKQSVSWRDLNLSFLISYKFGHYFQKETINYNALFNSWLGHGDFLHRWQSPGDENNTTIPSMVYPANNLRDQFYANSEANIENGGLVRLQDVNLNYTLVRSIGNKKYTFSVFGAVNNVALLWRANSSGLDPDYFNMPPSRRYSVGLNCKF